MSSLFKAHTQPLLWPLTCILLATPLFVCMFLLCRVALPTAVIRDRQPWYKLDMSGGDGASGRRGLLASLMGTLRRSAARPEPPKPQPEDLGLKTLRHVRIKIIIVCVG